MAVVLHGYRYSVYVRIARMVLAEKGVPYERAEVNPFAPDMPGAYLAMHPFGRVPVLVHDEFVLYETAAIARYVDEAFGGPRLQPAGTRERARMAQIISIVDSYGYWPMVRQVFSHRVFRPRSGDSSDEAEVRAGLAGSVRTLGALEALAAGDDTLVGGRISLADLHLAPMMAYFAAAPEGRAALARFAKLSTWWQAMQQRESLAKTEPGLPEPRARLG